jgi:hypothetical protein
VIVSNGHWSEQARLFPVQDASQTRFFSDLPFEPGLNLITVTAGTEVTYCFQVRNEYPLTTFALHDVVDDQLGDLMTAYSYPLVPAGTLFFTETVTIDSPVVNNTTWTAWFFGPPTPSVDQKALAAAAPAEVLLGSVEATASAQVVIETTTTTTLPTTTVAPTTTPPAATTVPTSPTTVAPILPATGADGQGTIWLALLLVGLGATLIGIGRRHQRT